MRKGIDIIKQVKEARYEIEFAKGEVGQVIADRPGSLADEIQSELDSKRIRAKVKSTGDEFKLEFNTSIPQRKMLKILSDKLDLTVFPEQNESKKQVKEKLGKSADAGDYIDDFKKSDAPQFKGKSDKKKEKMAVAAYLDSKEEVDLGEEGGKELKDLTKHFDKKKLGQDMVVMYSLTADPSKLKRMTTNKYAKQLKKLDNQMGTMKMQGDKDDHLDFVKYMHDLGVKPTIKVLKAGMEYKEEVKEEKRQLKDPKKEAMVMKVKDSGSIQVIDKKDLEKYLRKGYIQVEDNIQEALKN